MAVPAIAQTPPTATEVFNLRLKCKEMADKKAGEQYEIDAALGARGPEIILQWHKSKYDPKFNRCYIEQFRHVKVGMRKEIESQMHSLMDLLTDDMLAFAKIENGKKVGMVFDPGHRPTRDTNLGWDDANAYIDEMMLEQRR